jgi:hypothetical protein
MELQKKKAQLYFFFLLAPSKSKTIYFIFLDEEKGKYFPVYRNVFKIFISFFRFNPPFFEFHLEREREEIIKERKKEKENDYNLIYAPGIYKQNINKRWSIGFLF